jgi:rod shape-determining protein MreC
MSLRDNPLGELKVPLTWTAGIVFIVVLIASMAILLSEGRKAYDTDENGVAHTIGDQVMAPVGDVLSAPTRWTGAGVEAIRSYFFAISENRRLKAELKEMQQWRDVAIALKDTNERYRTLLGLKTDPPIPMASARIVTDSRGPFANSRLANAGRAKGVEPGNPVMSENGLVGRVVGVTDDVSRVLMLTDVASRVPVMVDRTNARAILTGDGGPNPRLEYLRGQDPVKEGDRILTSGDGALFPRGLPVGYAVRGLDGRWRVVLASDRAPIDYVRILLFKDFAQVVDRVELDKTAPPPPTPGAPPSNLLPDGTVPGSKPPATAKAPAPPAKPAADADKPAEGAAKPPAAKTATSADKPATSKLSSPDAKPATSKPPVAAKASDGAAKAPVAGKPASPNKPPAVKAADTAHPAKTPQAKAPLAKAAQAKPAEKKPAAPKPGDKAAAKAARADRPTPKAAAPVREAEAERP